MWSGRIRGPTLPPSLCRGILGGSGTLGHHPGDPGTPCGFFGRKSADFPDMTCSENAGLFLRSSKRRRHAVQGNKAISQI